MNPLKNFSTILILLLISEITNAQHMYAAAVTTNGILLGKYRTANDATNPLPDTISLAEAKNITAINGILVDMEKKLSRVPILDYQMTIWDKGDTVTIKNNSELLTPAMKERLGKINSGAKLYFEGIRAGFSNDESRSLLILSFTVI